MIQPSILAAALFAALLFQTIPAARAQNYPTGPITVIVSFPPGGSIDVVLRAMAPKLQERMGRPVVVENRAGGGGVIATAACREVAAGRTHAARRRRARLQSNPSLFKALPFDTLKDLQISRRCCSTRRWCWWSIPACRRNRLPS